MPFYGPIGLTGEQQSNVNEWVKRIEAAIPGIRSWTTYPGAGGGGTSALGFTHPGPTLFSGQMPSNLGDLLTSQPMIEGVGQVQPESVTGVLAGMGGGGPLWLGGGDTASPGVGAPAGAEGVAGSAGDSGVNLGNVVSGMFTSPPGGLAGQLVSGAFGNTPGANVGGNIINLMAAPTQFGLANTLAGRALAAGRIASQPPAMAGLGAIASEMGIPAGGVQGLGTGPIGGAMDIGTMGAGGQPAAPGSLSPIALPVGPRGEQGFNVVPSPIASAIANQAMLAGSPPTETVGDVGQNLGSQGIGTAGPPAAAPAPAELTYAQAALGAAAPPNAGFAFQGGFVGPVTSGAVAEGVPGQPGVSVSGDAGGAGASTVICTELYRQGRMPTLIFNADCNFGASLDPGVLAGYRRWGRPVARAMRRWPWLAALLERPVMAWATEMAYRQGALPRGSRVGWIIMTLGVPICRWLGR